MIELNSFYFTYLFIYDGLIGLCLTLLYWNLKFLVITTDLYIIWPKCMITGGDITAWLPMRARGISATGPCWLDGRRHPTVPLPEEGTEAGFGGFSCHKRS